MVCMFSLTLELPKMCQHGKDFLNDCILIFSDLMQSFVSLNCLSL